MTIKKADSGWLVDIQPGGRGGKRFRKSFPTKAEALAWETWLREKVRVSPEWAPAQKDRRRVSDLVDSWFSLHGVNLRNGAGARAKMLAALAVMGNPLVVDFGADLFSSYRAARITAGVSQNTVNREQAYLRAVFNELRRLGQWSGENPLARVRPFRIVERELSFLSLEQISVLLGVLSGDALLVTRLCLATGARWSEAETLRPSQLRGGMVHFSETKSGKNRSVPVSEALEAEILEHLRGRYGDMASMANRFFFACMGQFRWAVGRSGLVLPKGQLTHVLRHSFASHFMMNGGNILTLQRILGHSSLAMTMRYAHLAPDHLLEARALNPLTRL
ncbi:MAG: tyrosine-type recombinase/integrase [Betaproteobacteria bacterium]|nr:tyrosine-type recombinase/integrase [Betaproteobacteria bacterium]